MAYFDDFADAVANYPAQSVALSIVDRVVQPPGTAGAVNVNEVFAFQVRVANNGHLNLTGVTLHVEGQNGATVSQNAAGPFTTSIGSPNIAAVNAHGSQDTPNLFFKAPSGVRPAGTALVRAHISGYDVNLNHILISHTGHADPPSSTFSTQVFP
jgi:hypothetical protein